MQNQCRRHLIAQPKPSAQVSRDVSSDTKSSGAGRHWQRALRASFGWPQESAVEPLDQSATVHVVSNSSSRVSFCHYSCTAKAAGYYSSSAHASGQGSVMQQGRRVGSLLDRGAFSSYILSSGYVWANAFPTQKGRVLWLLSCIGRSMAAQAAPSRQRQLRQE